MPTGIFQLGIIFLKIRITVLTFENFYMTPELFVKQNIEKRTLNIGWATHYSRKC